MTLQSKKQNITSATTFQTNMNKPLYNITGVDALRAYGNHSFFSGWSTATNNRDWYFGTDNANVKRFVFQNEKEDGIYLRTGSGSGNTSFVQNKIITHSNRISLRRGGFSVGDSLVTVGEIDATNSTNAHLYFNGNGTNNIIVDSGLSAISLVSSNKISTSSTGRVFKRNLPTYSSGGEIGLLNSSNNTFHIVSNGTNEVQANRTLLSAAGMYLNSNVLWVKRKL